MNKGYDMKKIIIGMIAMLLFGQVYAQALINFTDITQQLSNGNSISLTVDLATCKVDDPNEIKIPLSKWFVKSNSAVYSDSMVSIDAVKYASGRSPLPASGLLQRGSIWINNNGNVQIVISFFDAETSKKWIKDVNVQCRLNEGVRVFSHS